MTQSAHWTDNIFAITLFAEDLEGAKAFYRRVFDLQTVFEGDTSAVFKFGGTLINIIAIQQADELIRPATAARPQDGARAVYTLRVEDVDARCADLAHRGVTLLNGPMDRPWGIRTASFQDPMGTIWELSCDL
ncbi:VOC family protein [Deinococcus koreensis]|uniref:Glyoxalase n=1 Tax=Deinococcus koreensis TaxID=2054903 RepID=A0A2K3UWS1_9DEIO|nr:VOC family protein [Deinococcus koreensis]PNY80970.1 glyoxalase [Deinococcus koreensis]